MKLLSVLLPLFACSDDPTLPAPGAAELPTGAATAEPEPPLHTALLKAGACAEDGTISHTEAVPLADGREVLLVQCAMFAYQGTYGLAWAHNNQPMSDQDGHVLSIVGLPQLTADGTLTWTSKDRGAGDCGHHYRYALTGDRFVQKEHRYRPCAEAQTEVPPPNQWPLASDTRETGHCTAAETAHFSCATSANKVLSLCGSPGMLQYRFGPVNAPELRTPSNSQPAAFTIERRARPQPEAIVAAITESGVTYQITESIGAGRSAAEDQGFVGVLVLQGGELLTSIPCTGVAFSQWGPLLGDAP